MAHNAGNAGRSMLSSLLGRANIYRNDETAQHGQRVGLLSALIGRAMGFSEDRANSLRAAATLHDIGKVGIPDRILLKPGRNSIKSRHARKSAPLSSQKVIFLFLRWPNKLRSIITSGGMAAAIAR